MKPPQLLPPPLRAPSYLGITIHQGGGNKNILTESPAVDVVNRCNKNSLIVPNSLYRRYEFLRGDALQKFQRIEDITRYLLRHKIPTFQALNNLPIFLNGSSSEQLYVYDQRMNQVLLDALHQPTPYPDPDKVCVFSHCGDSRKIVDDLNEHFKALPNTLQVKKDFTQDLKSRLIEIARLATEAGVHLYSDAFFIMFDYQNNKLDRVAVCDFDTVYVQKIDGDNLPSHFNKKRYYDYIDQEPDLFKVFSAEAKGDLFNQNKRECMEYFREVKSFLDIKCQ